ncbi:MAG: hypothetical protein D4R44_07550 [Actinobacteria bacterium]|nr:MAG: hypothetical protein D4R44_07550 [Actinomycetota bacterium]
MHKIVQRLNATILLSAVVVVGSSCATTINLSAPTTLATPAVTTLPTGTTLDLFTQMRTQVAELSANITHEDKTAAKTTLATVLNLWGALKPQIAATSSPNVDQTIEDMQRIVNLAKSSVERTRPADADKALRFLDLVLQSQH